MSDCMNCRSVGVNRREFLSTSSALAMTAVLAACGDGIGGGATGPSNVNASVGLADYTALGTVGGIAVVSGAGTVAINRAGFRCPNHGATFTTSGAWTGGQRTSGLSEFTGTLNTTAGTITITS